MRGSPSDRITIRYRPQPLLALSEEPYPLGVQRHFGGLAGLRSALGGGDDSGNTLPFGGISDRCRLRLLLGSILDSDVRKGRFRRAQGTGQNTQGTGHLSRRRTT